MGDVWVGIKASAFLLSIAQQPPATSTSFYTRQPFLYSYSSKNMSQTANSSMSALNYDGPRVPRRTPMACEFCRARKLKCDGGRPSCANCEKKKFPCNYVPVGDKAKK